MKIDKSALGCALKLLSLRMHTEHELIKKLYAKKLSPADIRSALAVLKTKGLINDARFAKTYSEELRRKASGDIRIRFQLKQKGLSEQLISECFEKENPEQQYERALEAAQMKLKPNQALEPKEKKRLYDLLVRKGFDYEVCRKVIHQLAKCSESNEWEP